MNKTITVMKNPTKSTVFEVTKEKLLNLKHKYPAISVSQHDIDLLQNNKADDIVGVVAGEIDRLDNNAVPDVWFINMDYFKTHYTVIED